MNSSFRIAGVGGTSFSALTVTIVALLISIEPLIYMARIALNVSGAMTAATITRHHWKNHGLSPVSKKRDQHGLFFYG